MKDFWDEFGYELVKIFAAIFHWFLGLFGVTVPEDLPEEYQ